MSARSDEGFRQAFRVSTSSSDELTMPLAGASIEEFSAFARQFVASYVPTMDVRQKRKKNTALLLEKPKPYPLDGPRGVLDDEHLTMEETEAVSDYRGGGYKALNKALRDKATLTSEQTTLLDDTKTALRKHHRANDVKVYRGLEIKDFEEFLEHFKEMDTNPTWTSDAFLSTSTRSATAQAFGSSRNGVFLVIKTKQGSEGSLLGVSDHAETSSFSDAKEQEVLFPPATTFSVVLAQLSITTLSQTIYLQEI